MSNQQPIHSRLGEIREFFQFLGGLMGVLSAISVFFPYFGLLVGALPVADEFNSFFSAFTSIVCAYTMLHSYGSRGDFLKGGVFSETGKRNLKSKATNSLISAIFFAMIFIILTLRYSPNLNGVLSLQVILLWGASFVLYLLVFGNLTKSFALLALSEYLEQRYAKRKSSSNVPQSEKKPLPQTSPSQRADDPQLKKKPQADYNPPFQGQTQELSFQSLDGFVTAAFIEDQVVRALNNYRLVEKASVKLHKPGGKAPFLRGSGNKESKASYATKVDKVTIDIEITRTTYVGRSENPNIRRYIDHLLNKLAEQHGLLFFPFVNIKN